jgi:hypothetical protein
LDGGVFESLKHDNTLSPIGRALWIWNHFLGDEMVATTNSTSVCCYASRRIGHELTLFLVNKETSPREAIVALKHLPREFSSGEHWEFHGSGPLDQRPT